MKLFTTLLLLILALPAVAAIDLSVVEGPHRECDTTTRCYAPTLVVFSGVGADDSAMSGTNQEVRDLEYSWVSTYVRSGAASPCGTAPSSGEGYYACGSEPGTKPKHRGTGAIWSQVFEEPGTYTVTLTVRNGTPAEDEATQWTVIISEWTDGGITAAQTMCYNANSSDFTGCPAGATQINQGGTGSWPTALGYFTGGTSCASGTLICKRVLLKGGETFTGASNTVVSTSGPAMIGSYGTGKAIIKTTDTADFSNLIAFDNTVSDLRFVDLEFDGDGVAATQVASAALQPTTLSNILFLRIHAHDVGSGMVIDPGTNTLTTGFGLVDSIVQRMNGGGSKNSGTGLFILAKHMAVVGTLIDDTRGLQIAGTSSGSTISGLSTVTNLHVNMCVRGTGVDSNTSITSIDSGTQVTLNKAVLSGQSTTFRFGCQEHIVRTYYQDRSVMSNSTLRDVQDQKGLMEIRGMNPAATVYGLTGAALATRLFVVTGNRFDQSTMTGSPVGIYADGDPDGAGPLPVPLAYIEDIIFERNFFTNMNIVMGGNRIVTRNNIVKGQDALFHFQTSEALGDFPAASNHEVYNNTFYSAYEGDFYPIRMLGGSGHIVKNNIGYTTSTTGTRVMFYATTGSTISHNTDDGGTTGIAGTSVTEPPLFVNASGTMTLATDFRIGAGSPYDATGTTVPVRSDYDLCYRSTNPVGAFNLKGSGLTCLNAAASYLPFRLSWVDLWIGEMTEMPWLLASNGPLFYK